MLIKPARALISVYDKKGLLKLGKELHDLGIKIISTGGTARKLKEEGISLEKVSSITGFPEILGGRVKSLHPKIHGGILARRDNDEDLHELEQQGIEPIDLVVVNLYPFEQVLQRDEEDLYEYIEMIDIGGPTLIRAAAKNFHHVTVVTSPEDYDRIIEELKTRGGITLETRLEMARKAFNRTAGYDQVISDFLFNRVAFRKEDEAPEGKLKVEEEKPFPCRKRISLEKIQDLRYGENPHQRAALYKFNEGLKQGIVSGKQLAGKPLSYNNLNDLNAAVTQVREFSNPAVSVVKHTNPCGMGESKGKIEEAFERALASDPVSAFGGIVALNRKVGKDTALLISGKARFLEIVAAPGFTEDAVKILSEKWKNLRIIELPWPEEQDSASESEVFTHIGGGFLIQERDTIKKEKEDWQVVTDLKPEQKQLEDLEFAWKVVKNVKSNAIVIARNLGTVGIGAGQMSRVDACKIAVEKGQGKLEGAVAASDAFFPFPDALETLAENGVRAIIQPGGSIRDEEVIKRANELGIVMIFTGERHFLH